MYGALKFDGTFFTETTKYDPHSPYSASKASSDHFVRAFHDTFGMPTLVTNCSNNYGPYQFPEKLIPLFINNIRHNKPLPVYGKGENVRDWLYVVDHARDVYKRQCSWYDFAKEIVALSGNTCDIRPCHSDEFPGKVKRPAFSVLDKTKVKRDFDCTIPYWKDSLVKCINELKRK